MTTDRGRSHPCKKNTKSLQGPVSKAFWESKRGHRPRDGEAEAREVGAYLRSHGRWVAEGTQGCSRGDPGMWNMGLWAGELTCTVGHPGPGGQAGSETEARNRGGAGRSESRACPVARPHFSWVHASLRSQHLWLTETPERAAGPSKANRFGACEPWV